MKHRNTAQPRFDFHINLMYPDNPSRILIFSKQKKKMLCDRCQNIQFKAYLALEKEEKLYLLSYCDEWPSDEPNDYSEDEVLNNDLGLVGGPHDSFYFHHRNLESLQKAANDGCNFCYQIFHGLPGTKKIDLSIEDGYDRFYLALQTPDICAPEREQLYRGDLDVFFGEKLLGDLRLKDLNDFVKFAPSSQNMDCNSSTGSPMNLDLAATWLHDCTNYHEHCGHQLQLESILPYRVLDLGCREKPHNIFLSVGEGRVGSYAALSYCWGKPGGQLDYLTVEKNLAQRQQAMDTSTLPKTFNDAIAVCRHLGIRFLWIDSLCIIQYDESDWQTQSSRMGDIYSNAALTIAAAVGEDSNSGLFVERDARKTYPCALNVQYPKEDRVIVKGPFLVCRDWNMPEPACLDTRGWTFQEKYLSPRTLTFSKTEMSWTCASKTASEGLPMGQIPLNNKSDFDRYIKVDANGSFSSRVDMRQRLHWWYETMEVYSYRVFTRESDRLIALAGLAAKFQTPGDEFLYGLWKSDLACGLAWRMSAENPENATGASLTLPIPSWSWASRPGQLITYSDNEMDGTVMEGHKSVTSIGVKSPPVTFFEVLNVDPPPLAIDLTALSTPPSLKLRALVLRVTPAESSVAYNEDIFRAGKSFLLFQYASSSKCRTREQFLADAFYDEPVTEGDNLYCLPLTLLSPSEHGEAQRKTREPFEGHSIDELASMQNLILSIGGEAVPGLTWCPGPISCRRMREADGFRCLLLKKIDVGVQFRRIGYLELHKGRLFDGVSPTTLEII